MQQRLKVEIAVDGRSEIRRGLAMMISSGPLGRSKEIGASHTKHRPGWPERWKNRGAILPFQEGQRGYASPG